MKVTFDIIKCEDCPHHSFNHDTYSTRCNHPTVPHHVGSWDYGRDMPAWCPLRDDPASFPDPPPKSERDLKIEKMLTRANESFAGAFEAMTRGGRP
jgi:hypothetical protein